RSSCVDSGIGEEWFAHLAEEAAVTALLDRLRGALEAAESDALVLGMLLGFELPAIDNISSVFLSVAHDAEAESKLARTKFFRLHMALEVEHVRLTVANFLRFCPTEREKAEFTAGFTAGIAFWRDYWRVLADLARRLSA